MTHLFIALSTVADGNMLIRDDKTNTEVIRNRQAFLQKNGIEMAQTTRISIVYNGVTDFCKYSEVSQKKRGAGMYDEHAIDTDALITGDKQHALFLPLADCVGAVIYDPSQSILMMSHLGRHSIVQHGGYKSIRYLVAVYGSDPSELQVWLTPAPGKESYPIWALDGKDMKEAVFEQLSAAGILKKNITDNPADTSKDGQYFSHSEFLAGRRDEDGRFAIVAMLK